MFILRIDIYPHRVYIHVSRRLPLTMPDCRKETVMPEEIRHCCCSENEIQSEAADVESSAMTGRTKLRSPEEYTDLIHRLNRIEGQIRGIRGMVEHDAYCVDILTQVAATRCALNSFTKILLSNHIRTCVANDLRNGKDESVDELVDAIQKLMK
jgi:DNA-binding FrmR family transcriptional regulator